MSACSKIRHIVRIREMLRRWRKKAAMAPRDVPAGHVAVAVGTRNKRFVVRATYLNHPLFKNLLVEAEEEFGFSNTGPLAIPCDESFFEEILAYLARTQPASKSPATSTNFQQNRHVGCRAHLDLWADSRPLLQGN